jgi:hypothetical protein
MINDMNKLIKDEVKAMYLIVFNVSLLLTTIESIPIIGIKTKDVNNMYIIKKNKYLCTV